MASSVTHDYFSVDVYDKLSNSIKEKISPSINDYKCFAQGPDPYFFYDFHLSKKSIEIFKIDAAMQHSLVNKHFISLINYINEKNYYSNSQVMAYLYGQICHFVLDSTVHPFIIYNTGIYDEHNKATYKYNGLHEEMEYYIDIYLIWKRERIIPRKYKVYKKILNISRFNIELIDLIDNVSKSIYNFDNVSKIYYKAIKDMKKFYFVFNYDKHGIKKIVYKFMDFICRNKLVRKEELSFYVDPNSKLYYLNNDRKIWNHPCDNNEKYNLSFFDLYDKALNKATSLIEIIDKMLYNRNIDNNKLEKLIGNLDYGTGKDCNLNLKFKYFKF